MSEVLLLKTFKHTLFMSFQFMVPHTRPMQFFTVYGIVCQTYCFIPPSDRRTGLLLLLIIYHLIWDGNKSLFPDCSIFFFIADKIVPVWSWYLGAFSLLKTYFIFASHSSTAKPKIIIKRGKHIKDWNKYTLLVTSSHCWVIYWRVFCGIVR